MVDSAPQKTLTERLYTFAEKLKISLRKYLQSTRSREGLVEPPNSKQIRIGFEKEYSARISPEDEENFVKNLPKMKAGKFEDENSRLQNRVAETVNSQEGVDKQLNTHGIVSLETLRLSLNEAGYSSSFRENDFTLTRGLAADLVFESNIWMGLAPSSELRAQIKIHRRDGMWFISKETTNVSVVKNNAEVDQGIPVEFGEEYDIKGLLPDEKILRIKILSHGEKGIVLGQKEL